jgi:hypothetical protein
MKRLGLALFLIVSQLSAEVKIYFDTNLSTMLEAKDRLGLRVYLKSKIKNPKLAARDWLNYRNFITENLTEVGYDILYLWDNKAPAVAETAKVKQSREVLEKADTLMLSRDFAGAFNLYQKLAEGLKSDMSSKDKAVANSAEILYPYVLDGMGRSLYSLGRYLESAEVFGWIAPSYPRYRRVLFEQMWAYFRAGRADMTLGKVASQFSSFFSEYHQPEAYLVQAYVHKKLCRSEELTSLITRMKSLRERVVKGNFTWKDWMDSDIEGFLLKKIYNSKTKFKNVAFVSPEQRIAEKKYIEKSVSSAFIKDRPRWLENMESAIAYAQITTGKNSLLKPVEKLPTRQELSGLNLEVWPADSREDWIDEIGSHRFVGESRCAIN